MEAGARPSIVEILTIESAQKLGQSILRESHFSEETVLGVDCEGLTKGRPLCLIQVRSSNGQIFYNGHAYLIDLLEMSLAKGPLKEVSVHYLRSSRTHVLLRCSMTFSKMALR